MKESFIEKIVEAHQEGVKESQLAEIKNIYFVGQKPENKRNALDVAYIFIISALAYFNGFYESIKE